MDKITGLLGNTVQGLSYYNNGLQVDSSHEKDRIEHIKNVGDSSALNPENITKFSMNYDGKKLLIVPLFDCHIGGQGFEAERFKMILNFINKTRNARAFFGGDMFDNANLLGKTNPLLSRLTPDCQRDYVDVLDELNECISQNKILFALYGNHDGSTNNRTMASGMSMVKDFCKNNNLPFVQYNALLSISLPELYGKEVLTTNIFATHGSSKTANPASACESELIKMENAMLSAGCDPNSVDIAEFGHLHIDGSMPVYKEVTCYDDFGRAIANKRKTLWVNCEPPMQGLTDFAIRSNMRSTPTNAYGMMLSFVKNPAFSKNKDKEFANSLNIERFKILSDFENEYSMSAKMILEDKNYIEPTEIREELEEKYLNQDNSIIKDMPELFEKI